jgi:hypothetical protein
MRNRQCLCGFAQFAFRASVAPDCPKERDFWLNRPQTVASLCAWRCARRPARSTPTDPSCHDFGSHRQQNLDKPLVQVQKYPNSFCQIVKDPPRFQNRNSSHTIQAGVSGEKWLRKYPPLAAACGGQKAL